MPTTLQHPLRIIRPSYGPIWSMKGSLEGRSLGSHKKRHKYLGHYALFFWARNEVNYSGPKYSMHTEENHQFNNDFANTY